jgi:hypothetical protein
MKDRNRLFFKNVLCAVYKMTFFVRLYATQKIDLCSLKIRETLAVFTVSVMQHGTYKQRPSSVVSCHWSTWVNSVADSDDSNPVHSLPNPASERTNGDTYSADPKLSTYNFWRVTYTVLVYTILSVDWISDIICLNYIL